MDSKKVYFVMLAAIGLLGSLVIATAVIGNNMLKKQSNKLLEARLQNHVLDEQQTALTKATRDIDKYADLEKIAKVIVPQDKDQAATVREIVKIASQSGINLSSITFPSSTLGQTTPKANGGESNTTDKSASSPITQVKPVQGLSGLYTMEITIQQDAKTPVTYPKLIEFLSKLEQNRRTAQVSGVSVLPTPKDHSLLTFSLTVKVYIKP